MSQCLFDSRSASLKGSPDLRPTSAYCICTPRFFGALVLYLRGNCVIHRGIDQLQGDDNGHVGRPCEVSLAPPYPEPFASYGSSTVTRTSGRGHVVEVKTNVIEVGGLSIRVSKETLLTLNVHFCVQLPTQRTMLNTVHSWWG
jgi:hypothetical protein